MKKFEAKTLEEAYGLACNYYDCSMSELRYEVVQYPSGGILGLFAKPAIIVALKESASQPEAEKSTRVASAPETAGAVTTEAEPSERLDTVTSDVKRPETMDEAPASKEKTPRENGSHEKIIERFFDESGEETSPASETPALDEKALQSEIEETLKELMGTGCFDIDVIEVDVIDQTAYIFMDGEDAALLIGKEGYRYNALSYLLYNWLHSRYKLYVKLEIAQFLSQQQEMIRHKLQPVIEHIEKEGWGRTRPLDGILVQIALEQLREHFPDKYVAIKRQRDGSRYVLVNEFNNRRR